MKLIFVISVTFAALLLPATAGAQEITCPKSSKNADKNKNEARRYFAMGITFFKMQKYKKSVASFSCVISLVPYSSMARYRLALSYKYLKMYKKALEHFKWVTVDVSKEAKFIKGKAKKHIQEIETILKAQRTAEEKKRAKAARRKAEEERQKAKALAQKRALAQQKALAQRTAAQERAKAAAARARAEEAKKKAKTLQGPTKTENDTPGLTSKWWFWTSAGATLAFTAATVVLGLKTMSLRDDYETEYDKDAKKDLINFRTMTDVALGAALVSGALLIYGILTHDSGSKEPTEVKSAVLPMCNGATCGLFLTFGF